MTGCVYDPLFLAHTLDGHAEHAGRLRAVMDGLGDSGLLAEMHAVPGRSALRRELERIHPPDLIDGVCELVGAGGGSLDPDTYVNRHTFAAAATACGSLIDLCTAVVDGDLTNGIALVRPPGHHALRHRAMGFCIFNNVAVAAAAVRAERPLRRLAIVDFDAHHGNGTEAIFADDPHTLYLSTHEYPHFPGTGFAGYVGDGAGQGATVNVPLPAGAGDVAFAAAYDDVVVPALRRFKPEFLLVSAGYDAHWADPLAGLTVSLDGFASLSRKLVAIAREVCSGRVVFALEGGYNHQVLAAGVANSIFALLGQEKVDDPLGPAGQDEPDVTGLLAEIRRLHGL